MRNEERKLRLIDGTVIELPLGLTYDIGKIALCISCGGVVQEHEPLIRRSTYRNRAFEKDFAARSGACLRCTSILLTNVVAAFYEKAEASVKNFNDLDQSAVKDEDTELTLDCYEQSIEAMQIIIERIGAVIGGTVTHQVEYAHDPEIRIDLPQPDSGTDEVPDQD